ncbi:hypothetical protein MIND_00221700 [Mycena indigotica]|uniref:Uncharacterized protein n=1 Tax=Mycena indigotica TaxID=2126181 RepID=A0A8H6T7A0_9AGAR|nr:uncharacterized protein MIND_00221700 [Mycena indigotica]KAF7312094.1 hypothetical protein MIND_00221700 [Mycena indigotica]
MLASMLGQALPIALDETGFRIHVAAEWIEPIHNPHSTTCFSDDSDWSRILIIGLDKHDDDEFIGQYGWEFHY